MTQITINHPTPIDWSNPFAWARSAWQQNKPLTILIIGSLILIPLTMAGMAISDVQILGESAWLKPAKFAVSITIYGITLLWLFSYVEGKRRLIQALSWVTLIGFIVEHVAIIWQASRGVRSHFNSSTPFDGLMYSLMGTFVLLIWICGIIAAILLIRQKIEPRAFGLALKFGIALSVVGGAVAGLMSFVPTPEQLAIIEAGEQPDFVGAHSVGVQDGGPGLPIVGWNTTGGDLRIPHFVGLHAMQVLPLLGLAIIRTRASNRQKNQLVWVAGLGYLALIGLLTWQALRGQSIVAPDALTLLVSGSLVGLMGLATAVILKQNN